MVQDAGACGWRTSIKSVIRGDEWHYGVAVSLLTSGRKANGYFKEGGSFNSFYCRGELSEKSVRTLVYRADRIIVTYRKKRTDTRYNEIVYAAKKIEWDKTILPDDLQYLPLPK